MAEKGEIIIPDISEETFKLFLRYLYTDTIALTARNVVPVFHAARKYCVDILVSLCEKYLATDLSVDNACLLLEQAHVFMMDSLTEECLRFIDGNPVAVLQSSGFTDLCLSCVTSIIGNDDLCVAESNVYEAVIRWAEMECTQQNLEVTPNNKRDVLGETLYTVRYLHVDEDFLLGRICSDMILKTEDVFEIVNHNRNQKALVSEKLNTKKRLGITHRFHRNNGPVAHGLWISPPVDEAISFKSSVDVYLHGFGSFHTQAEPSSVDVQVFEDDVCLVQATNAVAPSQPGTPYMGDVVLDNPIKIHAEKTYTILERSNETKNHYLVGGITKVTHQHVTIEFSDSPRGQLINANWGQIPYLLLSCDFVYPIGK